MAEPRFIALTAYDVPIPKALASRQDALRWAQEHGPYWPGARIVQRTARGLRTIWKHQAEEQAA